MSFYLVVTPFSAPEVHYHRKYYLSSDIWSLGYLFYYLLFGTFLGIKITKEKVNIQFPKDTPDWMKEILDRMLTIDLSRRYTIAEVLDRIKFMKKSEEVAGKYMPTTF